MAKITLGQWQTLQNNVNSKTNYFALKNDGDTAVVRMLYNTIGDVAYETIHEVDMGKYKAKVACLREAGEGFDNCPLCKAGNKRNVKLFIPLYIEEINGKEVKQNAVWERGQNFVREMTTAFKHMNEPLSGTPIEITRHGAKGDTSTVYKLFPDALNADGKRVSEFDSLDALSSIRHWSYDEMTQHINGTTEEPVMRRRSAVN